MGDNYLIIGRAKSGTTVISKNIHNSILNSRYHSEPKSRTFFEEGPHLSCPNSKVVKIIFEHWDEYPFDRISILHNKTNIDFHKIISITRDPRDELISRLFYIVYPQIITGLSNKNDFDGWVSLLQHKEKAPSSVPFLVMIEKINEIIGYNILHSFVDGLTKYLAFLKENKDLIFNVKYEDFIVNNNGPLESYLGFKLSANRSVGRYKRIVRTSSFNNWKSIFTEKDSAFFKKEIGETLTGLGYDDWDIQKPAILDTAYGSTYVRKLIREAKLKRTVKKLLSYKSL